MKKYLLILMILLGSFHTARAQVSEDILVDISSLEGLELTRDNILNFRIFSTFTSSRHIRIRGRLALRNLSHSIEYTFNYTAQPGMNVVDRHTVRPEFRYSSGDIRELFEIYNKLPQGIVEYCVEVEYHSSASENGRQTNAQCTFYKNDDLLLINLVYPENRAEIMEYNPMLTWMVTAPYAQSLQYKIRLAEQKEGQAPLAAVSRNHMHYEEKNIKATSQLYPAYARPLEAHQPYAWTIDVYYNNILIGGSEVWTFTIIEDTVEFGINIHNAFIDVQRESGILDVYTANEMKLKYNLQDSRTDTLFYTITDDKGQELRLPESMKSSPLVYGDNRLILDFSDLNILRHMKKYNLIIRNRKNEQFRINFRYVDQELIRTK